MTNKFEKKTRETFHDLHISQSRVGSYERLVQMLTPDYLMEDGDFFENKTCLDAGCGSNANATYSMLHHGAKMVYAFDLDETFIKTASEHLREFNNRYCLEAGNVLEMRYADESFDFVHCCGVLHHTADPSKGLAELARVTKKGGQLYILMYGKGGLTRDITSLLREKYNTDEEFNKFIDNLNMEYIHQIVEFILLTMKENNDPFFSKHSIKPLMQLLDEDLVLTIKDRITAPAYHEHSEEELRRALSALGFEKIQRLVRYPKIRNLRRFLSPFYHKYDTDISKMLYGSGVIQLKAVKN